MSLETQMNIHQMKIVGWLEIVDSFITDGKSFVELNKNTDTK